jgi:hypothetical protein
MGLGALPRPKFVILLGLQLNSSFQKTSCKQKATEPVTHPVVAFFLILIQG